MRLLLKQFYVWLRKGLRSEEQQLFEGNFNKDIKRLYSSGDFSQHSSLHAVSDEKLGEKLWNLRYFLEAWEETGLSRENKKERHLFKYKKDLAKSTRKVIHRALYAEAINLAKEIKRRAQDNKSIDFFRFIVNKELNDLSIVNTDEKVKTSQLIALTSNCLHLLKTINPDLKLPENIEKSFKKAAKAIVSFRTLKEKALSALSVSIAVVASVACGLFTGGFVYAFLVGTAFTALTGGIPLVVAIVLAVITGFIGFVVNARFFSKEIPEFLIKLTSLSRVTEYIDEEGKRAQLSRFKKYIYLPLAAIFSVTVGIASAAFCLAQYAHILVALPFLAMTEALPVILAVILAIAMTVIMFKAFVEVAPKLSFTRLWQSLKTFFKQMSLGKFGKYAFIATFVALGVFGLLMLSTGGLGILTAALGGSAIAAYFIVGTSFLGQLPFVILTVSNFCEIIGKLLWSIPQKVKALFRQTPTQLGETVEELSLSSKILKVLSGIMAWVVVPLFLIINALANGICLMLGKPSATEYVVGGAGALNSIAGNMVSNGNKEERSQADKVVIQSIKSAANNLNESSPRERMDRLKSLFFAKGGSQAPERSKLVRTSSVPSLRSVVSV